MPTLWLGAVREAALTVVPQASPGSVDRRRLRAGADPAGRVLRRIHRFAHARGAVARAVDRGLGGRDGGASPSRRDRAGLGVDPVCRHRRAGGLAAHAAALDPLGWRPPGGLGLGVAFTAAGNELVRPDRSGRAARPRPRSSRRDRPSCVPRRDRPRGAGQTDGTAPANTLRYATGRRPSRSESIPRSVFVAATPGRMVAATWAESPSARPARRLRA